MRRSDPLRLFGTLLVLAAAFAPATSGFARAQEPATKKADADKKVAIGKPIPTFSLKNYDGKTLASTDSKSKLTVFIFMSIQCPVSNAYNERYEKLVKQYADQVRFVGINSNSGESLQQVADHAKKHHFTFAVLKDDRNVIADKFKAQRTPEAWVVDAKGVARYHGAIDDSSDESDVKTHYLTDALDALLAGKDPPVTETKFFGCSIHRVKAAG